MDEPTRTLIEPGSAGGAGAAATGPKLDVVWTRDGRDRPSPSAPGDVIVVREGVLSRSLRARAPDGTTYLLEMQRDLVDPSRLPATWGPAAGNAAIEAVWRRRAAASAADTRRQPPVALGFDALPPALLCRERGVVFRPPSPIGGGPDALDECRADELLAALRLPAWTTTTQRFLVDLGEARSTGTPHFWSADPQPVRGAAVEVRTFDRLARDLGRLVDGDPARRAALAPVFPCIGCPEVPRCYARPAPGAATAAPGPPLAPKRLVPVAMYPFRAVAHRVDVVDFEEHADLLGGAPWSPFRSRHAGKWAHPGLRLVRESLEAAVAARAEPRTPLAALREKLALFEAVVTEVVAYHRTHGQAHLAISPERVVSHRLSPAPGEGYDVSLRGGLRAPVLDDLMEPPPGPPIWLVPPGAVEPYAHPDVVRAAEPRATAPPDGPVTRASAFRFGRPVPVRIRAGRVWTDDVRGTTEFELDVAGLVGGEGEVDGTDRVQVVVGSGGWERTVLWCRRDLERVASEWLPLRAFPVRLGSGELLDLRSAASGKDLLGTATVHRTYGAFYDLHALGMLLLRAVLDNSRQPLSRVTADVLPSAASFCRAVHDREGKPAWEELVDVFEELVRSPPLDAFLAQANACFDPDERAARAADVPRRVWAEVLAAASACLTRGGVGFADSTRVDPDPARFARPAENLLDRVRAIRAQLPAPRAPISRPVTPVPASPVSMPVEIDRRDVRIRELEHALRVGEANVARLQSEVESLTHALFAAEKAPRAAPDGGGGGEAVWRAITEDLADEHAAARPAPRRPDEPAVELVRTLLTEGLGTLSTLQDAVAELGGQEFAAEQRNLQRMVRRAFSATMSGSRAGGEVIAEALVALRALRTSLGSTISLLVEAHGRASKEGSRRLLLTLGVAMEKELDLSKAEKEHLRDILVRMDAGLAELIGRFYDPAFEDHLRQELAKRRRTDARRSR